MKIENMKMVKIHYTLKDAAGDVLDTSEGGEPLEYMHGMGRLIPGLEKELSGLDAGERRHVVVEPKDGYGEFDESLVQKVPRTQFDVTMPIEVGQQFTAETATGPFMVRVTAFDDDSVTVDGNHELAGKQLHFDVEIVDVRDPTQQELEPLFAEESGCGGGCGSCGGGCGGGCGDGGCGGCGN